MDILTSTLAPLSIEPSSSAVLWILVVGSVIAFFLAFTVGANDVANSFGTSVGSRVLTLTQACLLATVFETLGAVLIGYKVSDTVRKGIFDVSIYEDDEKTLMLGCLAALLASALWNILATVLSLPISGTHSIVGAMTGFTIVARGFNSIRWLGLLKITSSWIISPVCSGALSAFIYFIILKFIIDAKRPYRNGLMCLPLFYFVTLLVNCSSVIMDGPQVLGFDRIPLWAAFLISLVTATVCAIGVRLYFVPRFAADAKSEKAANMKSSNGADKKAECHVNVAYENSESSTPTQESEVSPAAGASVKQYKGVDQLFSALQVLTAIFGSFAHGGNDVSNATGPLVSLWLIYREGSVAQKAETPVYILLYGALGICAGLWIYGKNVIQTVGENLTKICPSNGFAIEMGAATTVLAASKIGLPISTTHCKVGSIVSVGFFNRETGGVNWGLFKGIVTAWVLTLPITAALSGAIMAVLLQIA